MPKNLLNTLLALIVALTLCGAASAQSLRCKGDLAQIGNSRGTILQKCGEPVMKDSFCKARQDVITTAPVTTQSATAGSTTVTINNCEQVEEWTYNPGYGQFMTMLLFEGGSLTKIRYGDRVMR